MDQLAVFAVEPDGVRRTRDGRRQNVRVGVAPRLGHDRLVLFVEHEGLGRQRDAAGRADAELAVNHDLADFLDGLRSVGRCGGCRRQDGGHGLPVYRRERTAGKRAAGMRLWYPRSMDGTPRRVVRVGEHFPNLELWDLGPEMLEAFRHFYAAVEADSRLIEHARSELPEELRRATFAFLDQAGQSALARYLGNFLPLWRASGKQNRELWSAVLRTLVAWEARSGLQLPKGALYYYWGESHLLHGDPDRGFILISRSLEEDRQVDSGVAAESPAAAFLRLDDQRPADLQGVSYDMVQFVRRRLDLYVANRHGQLTYAELRAKFLDLDDRRLSDVRWFFAYTVFKLMKLRLIHRLNDITDAHLAPMIFASVLANFLLVIDRLFKEALYPGGERRTASFLDHLERIRDLRPPAAARYRRRISNSRLYDERFGLTLRSLLDGTYRDQAGQALEPLERDLVLAYRLRNYSAHTVQSQRELWERFPDVLQALFNSACLAVERL